MNQNTVTRDDCMLIAGGPYSEEIRRLARAHLESLTEADELRSQKAALESRLDIMTKIAVAQSEISEAIESQLEQVNQRDNLALRVANERVKVFESQLAEARKALGRIYTLCNEGCLVGELEEPDDITVIEWIEKTALEAISEEAIDAAGALRAKPDKWKPSDPVWPLK